MGMSERDRWQYAVLMLGMLLTFILVMTGHDMGAVVFAFCTACYALGSNL